MFFEEALGKRGPIYGQADLCEFVCADGELVKTVSMDSMGTAKLNAAGFTAAEEWTCGIQPVPVKPSDNSGCNLLYRFHLNSERLK